MHMKVEKRTTRRGVSSYIKQSKLESTFPNLEVTARIYLTLPERNCSAERIFSALKKVKTEMRSTIKNEKFNGLMLLCTENDITMEIDYNDVINDFAMIKARKKPLLYVYNVSNSTKNKDI
ncbi:dimer_Tnp_hAT domain-containing protein [Trichonephila clavipes]|nr:dimer_Tnp_hAT domain-containing protein [Trichonephila clavipes]